MKNTLAEEARAIVVLAFRNGPIDDIYTGRPCPTGTEEPNYSRISDLGMRAFMKNAVNRVGSFPPSMNATGSRGRHRLRPQHSLANR